MKPEVLQGIMLIVAIVIIFLLVSYLGAHGCIPVSRPGGGDVVGVGQCQ